MSFPEVVDGRYASGAVLGLHLVEPVEKRQYLLRIDPIAGAFEMDSVESAQLADHPTVQLRTRSGPSRQGEHDRDRVGQVTSGAVEQVVGQFQEQRGLAR